jgi:hypothetical protein
MLSAAPRFLNEEPLNRPEASSIVMHSLLSVTPCTVNRPRGGVPSPGRPSMQYNCASGNVSINKRPAHLLAGFSCGQKYPSDDRDSLNCVIAVSATPYVESRPSPVPYYPYAPGKPQGRRAAAPSGPTSLDPTRTLRGADYRRRDEERLFPAPNKEMSSSRRSAERGSASISVAVKADCIR